ncbi:hypothetical protein [Pontibacterium sp.]|uniref:hypothetical protein n=1 Tax=Pontibacterium sp. TaxID=2036026 RepID=UPI003510F1C9
MTKTKTHRILLALDPGSPVNEALESAVDLALEQDAELHLMFSESGYLREVAGLPFCREVEFKSSRERQLSPQQVDRSLRSLARQLEHAFKQTLQTTHLRGSFMLHQDSRQQLLRRCGGGDVLWLSPATLMIRIPSARRPPRDTLYLVYVDSPTGEHAISLANSLLRRGYKRLLVFVPDTLELQNLSARFELPAEIIPLGDDLQTLQQAVALRATNTLLIPEDYLKRAQVDALLEAFSHSRLEMLLVL